MKSTVERTPNLKRYSKIAQELRQSLINAGRLEWVDTTKIDPSGHTYNAMDLFCGCGGITLGFKQANFFPLFGVDVDPCTCETFSHNFPEAACIYGRIENLNVDTIKQIIGNQQVHVLCAGFPCPGFSIAGLKDPNDPRNYLYREVVRIAEDLQPWFVMLENVPRLVTLRNFLLAICNAFSDIGYTISVLILESAKYGVPQIRPRTIFIGNRFGMKNPFPKPILGEDEYVPIEAAIDDLKHTPMNAKINHEWTKHGEKAIKRISEVPPGGSLYSSYVDAWKRQYRGAPSMTVKENHGGNHIHYELDRVLSAREMARLQSFPDYFIFEGTMKRALFQIGNAVPPLLAKHIALALRPSLDKLAIRFGSKTASFPESKVISHSRDSKVRFEDLRTSLSEDLRGIWDVYVLSDNEVLLYYPIGSLNFHKVLAERERLADQKLLGVEMVYEKLLEKDPERPRRSGCFRKTQWLAPDFNSTSRPKAFKDVKGSLEKESNWLSGGPRPS